MRGLISEIVLIVSVQIVTMIGMLSCATTERALGHILISKKSLENNYLNLYEKYKLCSSTVFVHEAYLSIVMMHVQDFEV